MAATCYRHPGRETSVSCSECGRPICPDCMVAAPVGIKCPECARQPRSARVRLKPDRAARAIAAVAAIGIALGFANLIVLGTAPIIGIVYPWIAGIAIGETVLWASGRYRGTSTNRIAIGGAVWAYVTPLIIISVGYRGNVGDFSDLLTSAATTPFYLIGVAICIFSAYRRVQ